MSYSSDLNAPPRTEDVFPEVVLNVGMLMTCRLRKANWGLIRYARGDSTESPAGSSLGALMPHRVHAWPSVAGVNASALPFLILRWRYGSTWVWEMDSPWQTIGDYSLAFLYMFAIALSRMVGARVCPQHQQGAHRTYPPELIWRSNLDRDETVSKVSKPFCFRKDLERVAFPAVTLNKIALGHPSATDKTRLLCRRR